MAKRKLNKQQLERVQEIQREYHDKAEQDSSIFHALVIAVFGKQLEVEDEQGQSYSCPQRQNLGAIVCGDRVICQLQADNSAVVVSVEPRQNLIQRTTKQGRVKPVAANIDIMFITLAIEPQYHLELIDRYIVAAEHADIEAVILFNKADLLQPSQRPEVEQQLAEFQALGYRILLLSAKQDGEASRQHLLKTLQDKTGIFVGQSGVGKSSLLTLLLPDAEVATGALSGKGRKGTHTTTVSRLYHLPQGGAIIDSPGIRDFSLGQMDDREIFRGFRELENVLGQCRFRNCSHEQEPGCAIQQALEQGRISQRRFQSLSDLRQWNRA